MAEPATEERDVRDGGEQSSSGLENFTYLATVGEGAYAVVYQCEDNRDPGRQVAVKMFKSAHEHAKVMALAVREIRLLRSVAHPNIINLLDAFTTSSGRVYMVFPFCGRSAHRILRDWPGGGGLPPQRIKELAWQVLQALAYLHSRKIVHRDVKPANILIDEDGLVRLIDFGFARKTRCGPFEAEQLSSYVFTRWYRAPEVLVGDVYGPAADIWSLGCTLAELASGMPLFTGRSTVDQLYLVMRCFGTLAPDQAARLAEDQRLAPLRQAAAAAPGGLPRGRTLRQRLPPGLSAGVLELIEACLQPDPRVRPTAEELLQLPWTWGITKGMMGRPLGRRLGLCPGEGETGAAPTPPAAPAPTPAVVVGVATVPPSHAAQIPSHGRTDSDERPTAELEAVAPVAAGSAAATPVHENADRDGSPATPAAAALTQSGPGPHLSPSDGAGAAAAAGDNSTSSTASRQVQRRGSKRQRADVGDAGAAGQDARAAREDAAAQVDTGAAEDATVGSGRQQAWRGVHGFGAGTGAGVQAIPAVELAEQQQQQEEEEEEVMHAVATSATHCGTSSAEAAGSKSEKAMSAEATNSDAQDQLPAQARMVAPLPRPSRREQLEPAEDEAHQEHLQDAGACAAAAEAAAEALQMQMLQGHSRSHLQVFGGPGDLLEEAAAAAIAAGLTQWSPDQKQHQSTLPRPPSLNSSDSGDQAEGGGNASGACSCLGAVGRGGGEAMLVSIGGAGTGAGGFLPPLSSASTSIASRIHDSTIASLAAADWVADAVEASGGGVMSPAHRRREMAVSGTGTGTAGNSGAGASGPGLGQRLLRLQRQGSLPRQGSLQGLKSQQAPHSSTSSTVAAAMWAAKSGGGTGPHGSSKEASMVSGEAAGASAVPAVHGKSWLGQGGSPRAAAAATAARRAAAGSVDGTARGVGADPAGAAAVADASNGSSGWLQLQEQLQLQQLQEQLQLQQLQVQLQQQQQSLQDSPRGSGTFEATFSGAPMTAVRPSAQVAAAIAAATAASSSPIVAAAAEGRDASAEAPAPASIFESSGYTAAAAAVEEDVEAEGAMEDESDEGEELEVHAVDLRFGPVSAAEATAAAGGSDSAVPPGRVVVPAQPAGAQYLTSPPTRLCSPPGAHASGNTHSAAASTAAAAATASSATEAVAAAPASMLSTLPQIRYADSPLPPSTQRKIVLGPAAAGYIAGSSAPSSMHPVVQTAASVVAGASYAASPAPGHPSQPFHTAGAAPAGYSPALGYSPPPGASPQPGHGFPIRSNSFLRNRNIALGQHHSGRLAHLPHGSNLLSPPPPPLPAATPTPGPGGAGFLYSPPRTGDYYIDTGDVAITSQMSIGGGLAPYSTDCQLPVAGNWGRPPPSRTVGSTATSRMLPHGPGGVGGGAVASGAMASGALEAGGAWPSSGQLAHGGGGGGGPASVLSPRFNLPPMPPLGQPAGRPAPRRMTYSGIAGADERDTVAMTVPEDAPLPPPVSGPEGAMVPAPAQRPAPLVVPTGLPAPSSGVFSPTGLAMAAAYQQQQQQPRHYVPQRTGKGGGVRALKDGILNGGGAAEDGSAMAHGTSGGGRADGGSDGAGARMRTALGARMLRRLRQVASSRWSNSGGSRTHAGGSVTNEVTTGAGAAAAEARVLGDGATGMGGRSIGSHMRLPQPNRSSRQATDSQLHFPAAAMSQPLPPPLPPPAPLAISHAPAARAAPSPRFFAGLQGLLRIGSPRDSISGTATGGTHSRGGGGGGVVWTDNPSAATGDCAVNVGSGGRHPGSERSVPGGYSAAMLAAAIAGATSTSGLADRHAAAGSLPLPKLPSGVMACSSGGGVAPLEGRTSSLTPIRSSSMLRRMAQLVGIGAGGGGSGGAAATVVSSGPNGGGGSGSGSVTQEVVSLSAAATAAAAAQARAQAGERSANSPGPMASSGMLGGGSGGGSELKLPDGLSPSTSMTAPVPAASAGVAPAITAAVPPAYNPTSSRLTSTQQHQQSTAQRQSALSISGGGSGGVSSGNSCRVPQLPPSLSMPEGEGESVAAADAVAAAAGTGGVSGCVGGAPDTRHSGGSTSDGNAGSLPRGYGSSSSLPSSPIPVGGAGGLWGHQHAQPHVHAQGQYQPQSPLNHMRSPSRLQMVSTSPLASAGQLPSAAQLVTTAPASPGLHSPTVTGVPGTAAPRAMTPVVAMAPPSHARLAPRQLQAAAHKPTAPGAAPTSTLRATQSQGQVWLAGDALSGGIPHLGAGGPTSGERTSAHAGAAAGASDAYVSIGPVVMARTLDAVDDAPGHQEQQQMQELVVLAEVAGAAVDRVYTDEPEVPGLVVPATDSGRIVTAAEDGAVAPVSEHDVTLMPQAPLVQASGPPVRKADSGSGPVHQELEADKGGGGNVKKGKKGVFGRLVKSVKEAFK
ncbi:hypothetical protein HYH02_005296 [Chlamydomonas schloesseri]|uniref:cyclin-dependent kinase n=1 Tax=Chlamydomonas schloesseri TaxID=2026947 RepID=A0A835WLS2_9CHLO|nr:hypothetical protein HYH02_005296 [Chlamydomonas schloesseri]|eukprot:KAG2449771.1 hypothetical protein HYH02_005296 [Chlamydomonas schloesseri]